MTASVESIQTDRLILERLGRKHQADLGRLHRDPRVADTLGGVRSPEETARIVSACEAHWDRYGFGLWAARDKVSGEFAGRGGLKHTPVGGRDEVEVAYAFLPQFWGQGLATELALASVRVGFDVLGLHDLVCFTLTTNLASQRVMEKAGFRCERHLIHADLPHVLYRLTAAAWCTTALADQGNR